MKTKTLAALKGSILKWKRIVKGTGVDLGTINCPLCQLFCNGNRCNGCPVKQRTGQVGCIGSPYGAYVRLYLCSGPDHKLKAAAQAELDFLRSLLPKAKKKTK